MTRREQIAEIIKEGIQFSPQVGDYVITGAINGIEALIERELLAAKNIEITEDIRKLAEDYARNHSQAPDKETPDWIIQDFIAGYLAAQKKGEEREKLIRLMNIRTSLLRAALEQIRDFDDESDWEDPGQIAMEALKIQ